MCYCYYDIPADGGFFTIGDDNYTSLASMELCDQGAIQDIIEVWFIFHGRIADKAVHCAMPVGSPNAQILTNNANRTTIIRSFRAACNGRRTCSPDIPLYTYLNRQYKAVVVCAGSDPDPNPVNYNRVEYTCPGKIVINQIAADVCWYV